LSVNLDRGVRSRIVTQALKHLSMEELTLLEEVSLDGEQGTLHSELTAPELAAVEVFNVAVELECKSVGVSSLAEFRQAYSGTRHT